MEDANRISVEQCCVHYHIETSFVYQLDEQGLIQLSRSDESAYVSYEQLADLEKYIHLYYDLDINMAGMEAIGHLLQRMQELQTKLNRLEGG